MTQVAAELTDTAVIGTVLADSASTEGNIPVLKAAISAVLGVDEERTSAFVLSAANATVFPRPPASPFAETVSLFYNVSGFGTGAAGYASAIEAAGVLGPVLAETVPESAGAGGGGGGGDVETLAKGFLQKVL